MQPYLEQRIRLQDGRHIGYAEYGIPDGKPVFYFHGWPGSRLEWPGLDPEGLAERFNLRILAVDRPGYGLSDPKPGRRLLDWPDDVAALADALGFGQFSGLGYSGGTPFALATAFRLAHRLKQVVLVATAAPFQEPGIAADMLSTVRMQYTLARRVPFLYRFMWRQITPERFIEGARRALPEPDLRALERPPVEQALKATASETGRVGIEAAAWEGALISSPWGFSLNEIKAAVSLWHGTEDKNYPLSMAQYVATAIPGCKAHIKEDEGHLSIGPNHIEEILAELAQ